MIARLSLFSFILCLFLFEVSSAQQPIPIRIKEVKKASIDTLTKIRISEPVLIEIQPARKVKFTPQSSTDYSIFPKPTAKGFDGMYTSIGDIFRENGTSYLLYNDLVGGWPSKDINIALATSNDLKTWKREEDILLSKKDIPFSFGGNQAVGFATSIVKHPNDTYYLYFDVINIDVNMGIAVATAPSLKGPWKVHDQMILTEDKNSWDAYHVTSSQVHWVNGEFRMYYAGTLQKGANEETAIGMATSKNGIDWEKRDKPIFTKSSGGFFDNKKVDSPKIFRDKDSWIMIYRSDAGDGTWGTNSSYGIAKSKDGISWSRIQQDAILSEDDVSNWMTIWSMAFLKVEDTYHMFLEYDGPPVYGTRINHATFDGVIPR